MIGPSSSAPLTIPADKPNRIRITRVFRERDLGVGEATLPMTVVGMRKI
jgi:hypothetical protein